jgi:polyvinyl alcohol dehydrogenase (cytochrome)
MRKRSLSVVCFVLGSCLPLAGYAQAETAPPPRPIGGQAAIDALGQGLGTAARLNDRSSAQLKELLRTDRTARIGSDKHLVYVDDPVKTSTAPAVAAGSATQAAFPLDQTFSLHSDATSPHKIFLDFDGATVSGTYWNTSFGVTNGPHPGYDTDGDPSTFSDSERTVIQSVWARVSEDYAPLAVDVTTEDPGPAGLTDSGDADDSYGQRLMVSSDDPDTYARVCSSSCGGISYVGLYGNPSGGPSWIFTQGLSGGTYAKYLAEAASHEVGHSLGLSHDGVVGGTTYYGGQNVWAPIMGVGYYKPLVQFSKGEYPGANNHEDDFAVMTQHGLALRDPVSGSATSGYWSTAATIVPSRSLDYQLTTTCAGQISVSAEPDAISPDVDIKLSLLSAAGQVLRTDDPPAGGSDDTATGLGASLSYAAEPGSYVVRVEGSGLLDGGNSTYGSVGRFRVTSTSCQTTVPSVPTAVAVVTSPGVASLSWEPPVVSGGSVVTGYRVARDGVDAGGYGAYSAVLPASARSVVFKSLRGGLPYHLTVSAVNAVGTGPAASVTSTTTSVPGTPAVTVSVSGGTATVTWAQPAYSGGSPITGFTVKRDGTDVGGYGAYTTTVGPGVTTWAFLKLKTAEPYTFTITANNALGSGKAGSVTVAGKTAASWGLAGHDLANSRSNASEHVIGDKTVTSMEEKWEVPFTTHLTGTPSVVDGYVYLPVGGTLAAYAAGTGKTHWSKTVASYTGLAGDTTRNTAVAGGRVVFGDRPPAGQGARLVGVNAANGAKLWSTVVDTQASSVITGAPTIDGDVAYVGVSSREEGTAACCSFRGSVVAVNVTTGKVLWRTYTAPVGYTGAAVWSSAPVVDHTTGLLYVGTGNNYTVPRGVCMTPAATGCTAPASNDYVDSLLALRLSTGTPAWALRTLASDVSSHQCTSTTACGPDFDFGSDPNLFTATIAGRARTLVGIGQKSGIYWAADAATGALVWSTRVGPGGPGGGIQWGSATDGVRIYVSEVNSAHTPWTLPSGAVTTGGFFSALDPATGKILWQTPDPQGAGDFGYVSVANGVVYAGSGAGSGTTMYALHARTGSILWSFASGGSVMGGAAIVDGRVYWASGYYTNDCVAGQTACGKKFALYSFGLPAG